MSIFSRFGWAVIRKVLIGIESIKGNTTDFSDPQGPITKFSWGHFVVAGSHHAGGENPQGVGSDIRIVAQEVTAWSERQGHLLSPEMITGVGECEVLILGLGVCGALKCPDEVLKAIRDQGISSVHCLRTPDACAQFNKLHRDGKNVALLSHGTC